MRNWGLEKPIVQDHLQSGDLNLGVPKAPSLNHNPPVCPIWRTCEDQMAENVKQEEVVLLIAY